MNITKKQLKHIIKEELKKVVEVHDGPSSDVGLSHDNALYGELERLMSEIMPAIEQTYNMFGSDNELKAEFEKAFMKNMHLLADKWKVGRGITPSSQMSEKERLASMFDFFQRHEGGPEVKNPFRGPSREDHEKMRRRARQGKHGIPPHE